MNIVIVGYSGVGARTAWTLDRVGHEVIVVEDDPEKARRAERRGFDVVEGDGSSESVLEAAGVDDAEAVGALTGDLNVNFSACIIAKHHGCRTVLRIDADYREEIYKKYADHVDEIIYPERLGAAGAKTALLGGDFDVLADLTERLQITVFQIESDSPVAGETIYGVDLPGSAQIYAHGRERDALTIPLPGTRFRGNDRVAVIVETQDFDAVQRFFGE